MRRFLFLVQTVAMSFGLTAAAIVAAINAPQLARREPVAVFLVAVLVMYVVTRIFYWVSEIAGDIASAAS